MKRILIYIIVLLALTKAPLEGVHLGMLRPVEVVMILREGNEVVILTDTEDMGRGADGLAALENLKATTPGNIYLDTAEYLLLTADTEAVAEQLRSKLRASVGLCTADKGIDLQLAAKFLPAHDKLPALKAWKQGEKLPYLKTVGERLQLVKS